MASESKSQIYQRSGLGHRIGFGKRPALLIVDMQIGFTAPEKSPLAGNLEGQVSKYGDVVPPGEVLSYIDTLPSDGPLLKR